LRKAMFIPYNIIFDSLNKGDAIVVSFVQKWRYHIVTLFIEFEFIWHVATGGVALFSIVGVFQWRSLKRVNNISV
jgi:hypothetical protein